MGGRAGDERMNRGRWLCTYAVEKVDGMRCKEGGALCGGGDDSKTTCLTLLEIAVMYCVCLQFLKWLKCLLGTRGSARV